jgi:hypothetical protein
MEIGVSEAILTKLTTLSDGGIRIALDLPANQFGLAQKLLKIYADGDPLLTVAFVKED